MKTKSMCFSVMILMLFTLVSFSGKSQTPDFTTEVQVRFNSYLENFGKEKVYLQTDKPYYSAGENIWFKGYLVNAATLRPESLSGFIYVELINRDDSVFSRVKIQKDLTGFSGHISLDQALTAGDYNLRAYTQWMQNDSTDFFYSKNIYVGNKIEDAVNWHATYGDMIDGQVLVNINFADEHNLPFGYKQVDIWGQWLDLGRKKDNELSLRTSAEGNISFNLPIDTANNMPKVLELSLSVGESNFETQLFLPDFSNDFDVQFFSESGVFMNNGPQYLAFKAIGTDGMSTDISGGVYSQNGIEFSKIKTQFNGMGKFLLNTTPGESYYVIAKSGNGIEKRFELPKLENEGVSLHLNSYRGNINYIINNRLADQSVPLYLLIHSNGKAFSVSPVNNLKGKISESNLDAGIFAFSIVDSLGNVYCERLFFNNETSFPKISMQTDKEVYGKREMVNLSFKVQPDPGKTPEGFYSVSVTDSHFVKLDTINDNIISYLLLSSDLKGHIENPTTYFTDVTIASHIKLDLLMLTQGWRRYDTSKLLKDQLKHGDYFMEAGQTLTGKVVNYFGKPVKDSDVFGLIDDNIIVSKTNALGEYVFDGIGFQDSVTFVLRAEKKGTISGIKILPNEPIFPTPNSHFITRSMEYRAVVDEYADQSRLKLFSDGGVRHIYLDEVTINASRVKNKKEESFFSNISDTGIKADQLRKMEGRSIYSILSTIPGVIVSGKQISIRGNSKPIILIDGLERPGFDDLDLLDVANLEKIQVYKGAAAAFLGRGSDGVIEFITKRGFIIYAERPLNMATIYPLGAQKPEEFYVPKYEVQTIMDNVNPDLRTTIYWNPYLSSDSSGMVNVEFYTADPANDYSVVLEGITKEGEICRYEGVVKRN